MIGLTKTGRLPALSEVEGLSLTKPEILIPRTALDARSTWDVFFFRQLIHSDAEKPPFEGTSLSRPLLQIRRACRRGEVNAGNWTFAARKENQSVEDQLENSIGSLLAKLV
jgi:hypothetical protein